MHAPLPPRPSTVSDVRTNLDVVRREIAAACERAGRDATGVRLLPVTKELPDETLRLAYAAGCREFGENKVQEADRKSASLSDLSDVHWSVIGHLQTNKARHVARFAAEFQALDSLRVAEALDRRLQARERTLDVLVQVNTSDEASKFGLRPSDLEAFLEQLPRYPALRVRGLMTLAVFSADRERVRACFIRLRELRDRARTRAPNGVSLDELSMGMSGDYPVAIEEGATIVRVGQALFGSRALTDEHYWPGAADGRRP
ncbi:MAG: YggS family pyridoxal phosphate-dependent enzyme [Solirubrobacteraceae bacterium]